ncbi:MAG: glutathione S-transferase family protein [Polaromonas sp.]|uniref:glutathione S-transferase family protein n=1 Tax=Polaromonas sp. TaxID=1869339 RepID=UPI002736DC5E|nr:glutathione S-transferase family protein [Polaromonas sp.]MDP3797065.1 glutathione S-transferase family protein [Polaromonas sp.]
MQLTLISHTLCPYVQRAAIVLAEKGVAFERRDVDLANKPDWFLGISPLGKTPVLLVGTQPVFESAVICEYLDETVAPPLHPAEPLSRARHRGWMEFGSVVLNLVGSFYTAPDATALQARREELIAKFALLERVLPDHGPYFAGEKFSLVDAVFGPVFRYFDVFEQIGEAGFFEATTKVRAWRHALAQRPSVRQAVSPQYPGLLRQFLLARNSELSRRMLSAGQAPAGSSCARKGRPQGN